MLVVISVPLSRKSWLIPAFLSAKESEMGESTFPTFKSYRFFMLNGKLLFNGSNSDSNNFPDFQFTTQ